MAILTGIIPMKVKKMEEDWKKMTAMADQNMRKIKKGKVANFFLTMQVVTNLVSFILMSSFRVHLCGLHVFPSFW